MKKSKKRGGQQPHVPTESTRGMVEMMTAAGLNQEHIASVLRITVKTLLKYYREEIDRGWAVGVADAANVVITAMKKPDGEDALDAAKYFLSRRGKGLWSETKNLEVSGPNGGAIPMAKIDLEALDYDELEALDAILSNAVIEGEFVEVTEDEEEGDEDGDDSEEDDADA
jgi:hypothetical protein